GCAVVYCPREVVNVDVVAKDLAGVAFDERDRCAGKRNQGCVRQCSAQVMRISVEVVIVASVRLIDHHDDVTAVTQEWMILPRVPFLFREPELLQGREVDAAGDPCLQLVTEPSFRRDSLWLFWQQQTAVEG